MMFSAGRDVYQMRCLLNNILKRYVSHRINVQKPREPHAERQKYLILSRPMFEPHPDTLKPPALICRKDMKLNPETVELDNPYERLMAEKVFELFNDAKLVLIFHGNSMNADQQFHNKVLFFRNQMHYKKYYLSIVRRALRNTKFENVLSLFDQQTVFVVSQEIKLKETFQMLKKMPEIVLLAGIMEDRIVSRAEMAKYVEVGDITNARAELVATLNSAAQNLVKCTTQPQQMLASLLDQHINLQSKSGTSSEDKQTAESAVSQAAESAVSQTAESAVSQTAESAVSQTAESAASQATETVAESTKEEETSDSSESSSSDSDSDSDKK